MKILNSGIKIRRIDIRLEEQVIDIIYEQGISVKTLNITIEQAKEINFMDFEKLNKIL
jgi:hypothetical protein